MVKRKKKKTKKNGPTAIAHKEENKNFFEKKYQN